MSRKHTTKISDSQLSLFDPTQYSISDKPLPELIASKYNFPLQQQDIDNKYLYSVRDWIACIAQTEDPNNFWNAMKRRYPELGTRCTQLSYTAKNGRKYKMDYANDETLYIITANMDKTTGLRQLVIGYLAKAGVALDEFRRDPGKMLDAGTAAYQLQGKSEDWIVRRVKGTMTRKEITATLREVVIDGIGQTDYATFTNVEYQGLFQRTAAEIRKQTGEKYTRNGMTSQALAFVQIAEDTCNTLLRDRNEVTFVEACNIMHSIVNDLGLSVSAVSRRLGVDIATGQILLHE